MGSMRIDVLSCMSRDTDELVQSIPESVLRQMVKNIIEMVYRDVDAAAFLTLDAGHAPGFNCIYKELKRVPGVKSVYDLTKKTEKELLDVRGIGPATLRYIKETLHAHGLKLADKGEVDVTDA